MNNIEAFEGQLSFVDKTLSPLSDPQYRALLDALPAAVYVTDTEGTLTYYNRAAAEFAGREPRIGLDKWCVAWKLYNPDGTPLPLDQCPMAVALKERREVRGRDIIAERPSGERVATLPFPTPTYDEAGRFTGAINLLVDISRLKFAERQVELRAAEQATLFRFTDRLYRAEDDAQIYEAALDAIVDALGCQRASILLFDSDGVMRFVADRGLSDGYKAAVEGHSPWKPTDKDPSPIFVEDISLSDESERLKRVVRDEGITALGFIPLLHDGMVIGKFMTYHDTSHRFSETQQGLALTIARQLGFAVSKRRADAARRIAQDEAHESAERLKLATAAGKVGLWDWDIETNKILWTESLYSIHGLSTSDFAQTFEDWIQLVHADDRERVRTALSQAIHSDARYELELRTLRPDGGERTLYTNAVVLREAGRAVRMVGAAVDITERIRSEREKELLVAELSHRVKNTLSTVVTIARQSFANKATLEAARQSFDARISALAQTHTRLAEANWSSVELAQLVDDELAPYSAEDGGNIAVSGPTVALSPKQAVILGMALHELATNAAKYGALSEKTGVVQVTWSLSNTGQLSLDWSETGGPPVTESPARGFGRLLLERALAADLGGDVALHFRPSGLACHIAFDITSRREQRAGAQV